MPERAAWYACLDTYAQVQMMSSKDPSTLSAEGIVACTKERHRFQVVYRNKIKNPSQIAVVNADQDLAFEDFLAGRHLLLFVLRYRIVE